MRSRHGPEAWSRGWGSRLVAADELAPAHEQLRGGRAVEDVDRDARRTLELHVVHEKVALVRLLAQQRER